MSGRRKQKNQQRRVAWLLDTIVEKEAGLAKHKSRCCFPFVDSFYLQLCLATEFAATNKIKAFFELQKPNKK